MRMLIALLIALSPSTLAAQETGGTVVLRGTRAENTYAVGGTVDVQAEIEADLLALGGTVAVRRPVAGDVTVAGGTVDLMGAVGGDIRAAGGTVTVQGDVGGEVVAAGGTVTVAPDARVAGRAWLSGGHVAVAGRIERGLGVAAASVSISGEVDGDARIAAPTIEVRAGARITGDLVYAGASAPHVDPGAHIGGRVTPAPSGLARHAGRIGWVVRVIGHVVLLGSLIVAGAVLVLLWPHFTISAARTIGRHPWRSLGLGLLVLVVPPIAAGLLMVTIIGIPVGLALAALYGMALLVGYLTASVFVGDAGARLAQQGPELSRGARLLSLVLALVVLAAIGLVPVLGALVGLLTLLAGLGAFTLRAYERWAGAP